MDASDYQAGSTSDQEDSNEATIGRSHIQIGKKHPSEQINFDD